MKSSREADIHFLAVGWHTGSCFPARSACSALTHALPLTLPHVSFGSTHSSWTRFLSYAFSIWEFILWFVLISSVYMQFLFFPLRFFYFFFFFPNLHLGSFSHFSGTMFFRFFIPTALSLLPPMLSGRKVACGPQNPEYPPLFPLHLSLYDDWD